MKSTSWKVQALTAIVTLLLSVSKASHSSYCQIWQADIQRADDSVKVSRNYRGLWLSEKCEVHPGPQFVLRRYQIFRGGRFHLVRYYYQDPWCTSPSFTVSAVGDFVPPPEKATSSSASWVVPGGIELDFTLRKITLIPFNAESAADLSRKVNSSCPGAVLSVWKPYKKYKVLSYDEHISRNKKHFLNSGLMEDMDCTNSLGLSFNELQLMRLEHRIPLRFATFRRHGDGPPDVNHRYNSYLFLGADASRSGNRPTYYQAPLLPSQTTSCRVCRMLSKASATSPPDLLSPHILRLPHAELKGQWISLRCEVRPYGLFLRRFFVFNSQNKEWEGKHEYYKDPLCKNPMFTLKAKGLFFPGPPSKVIPDAIEYDFQITETSITPEDPHFVTNLNGLPTCGPGPTWKISQTVNLTKFGGCKDLGIEVPTVELDIIRFESEIPSLLLLYLGDTTEDHKRPTSFQPALVQCSPDDDNDYDLLYNELQPLPLISKSVALREFQASLIIIVSYYILLKFLGIYIE